MELSDTNRKITYEWISDDSSTTISASESAKLYDVSEDNRTALVREPEKDRIDVVREDMGVGEKFVPVKSVKCHNVEMAQPEHKGVSMKKVTIDEGEAV